MTCIPPEASCIRQQGTAAANFLSLGGCASRKSLVAVPNMFPQRRIRQVIPPRVQTFLLCDCALRASAAATHTAWSFRCCRGARYLSHFVGQDVHRKREVVVRDHPCSLPLSHLCCGELWQAARQLSVWLVRCVENRSYTCRVNSNVHIDSSDDTIVDRLLPNQITMWEECAKMWSHVSKCRTVY